MINKALWKKHYKQTKYLIWGFLLVSMFYPINILNEERVVKQVIEANYNKIPEYYSMFQPSLFVSLFQMILLVGMASILLGLERSNQSMDFTLTLPYKRKEILRSKWLIGVLTILSVTFISFFITSIILYNSTLIAVFPYQSFVFYYSSSVIYLIGIYSFSLFVGLIVGNHVAQFILTWIFLLLPVGLYILLSQSITYHYDYLTETTFGLYHFFYSYERFFLAITMPISLLATDFAIESAQLNGIDIYRFYAFLLPIAISIIFFSSSNYLSKNMRSEQNGKLIIYKPFESFFTFGVVVCFYLLGGKLTSIIMYPLQNIIVYHIGGLLCGGISFAIVKFLLGKKLHFKSLGGIKNV
jgi:acetoin utilization transport system permease protein